MQADPKEAKKRFQNDSEVDKFMKEFGRVMAGHFNSLGGDLCKDDEETSKKSNVKISVLDEGDNFLRDSGNSSNSEKKMNATDVVNGGEREAAGTFGREHPPCSSSYGVLQAEAMLRHR